MILTMYTSLAIFTACLTVIKTDKVSILTREDPQPRN